MLRRAARVAWGYAGLAGPLSAVLALLSGFVASGGFFGERAGELSFLVALLVSAILAAVAMAGAALAGLRPRGRVSAGSLVAAAGVLCAGASGWFQPIEAGAAVSGALMGSGLCCALLHWGWAYAALGERPCMLGSACSLLTASAVALAILALSETLPWMRYAALVACLAGTCLLPRRRERSARLVAGRERPPSAASPNMLVGAVRQWKILGCFLLCLMIFAAIASAQLFSLSISSDSSIASSVATLLGLALSAAVLVGAARRATDAALQTFGQALPLACVALVLVGWFFAGPSGAIGRFSSSMTLGFSLGASGLLLWARSLYASDVPPLLALGMAGALCGVFMVSMLFLWPLVGDPFMNAIDLCLMVVYLAVAALEMIVAQREKPQSEPVDHGSLLRQRCRELSVQYRLTKREEEVLYYVVQGHAAPYIAEELFVSSNTVKTHIRRVYAKAGIHSKEKLLELVYR